MEEMMYFFVVVASATFVVKTIVGWVHTAKYENERKVREAERKTREETWHKARLESLEKFQANIEKKLEE